VTRDEVISVTGAVEDRFVPEILALGADHAELVEASSRARGVEPVFVADRRPMPAKVTRLRGIPEAADIVASDPLELDERR
jgi:hypothetical protein